MAAAVAIPGKGTTEKRVVGRATHARRGSSASGPDEGRGGWSRFPGPPTAANHRWRLTRTITFVKEKLDLRTIDRCSVTSPGSGRRSRRGLRTSWPSQNRAHPGNRRANGPPDFRMVDDDGPTRSRATRSGPPPMPTSEARIAANRPNARTSTGPRTEEGKAVSRRQRPQARPDRRRGRPARGRRRRGRAPGGRLRRRS